MYFLCIFVVKLMVVDMKKLILMFFIGTLSLVAQHKNKSNIAKIVVRGVVLSYNKTDKIMSLYAKNSVFTTNDPNMKVKIEVYRNFSLKMVMDNGVTESLHESFFTHEGYFYDDFWAFFTIRPSYCVEITSNTKFEFKNVDRNAEYILSVSDICDDKYETNIKTGSIIIN